MRILHTGDWHLGRLFDSISLIDDQRYALEQLVAIVERENVEVIIIAGDVYDRTNALAEAIQLMDWTMKRLVLDLKRHVVLIAGNHDSAERINCFAGLLEHAGLHVSGKLRFPLQAVQIRDNFGPVDFYPVPFCNPESVRFLLGDDSIRTAQQAYQRIVAEIGRYRPAGDRAILVGHAFLANGRVSESERQLSVGGVDAVDSSLFDTFAYAAFGHLHEPQELRTGLVRYSGSLMKYSASEASHAKSVTLLELSSTGTCTLNEIPLKPKRDYRRIRGKIETGAFFLEEGNAPPDREDFVEVTLTNTEPVLDAMAAIRKSFPSALNVLFEFRRVSQTKRQLVDAAQVRTMSAEELFVSFYQESAGTPLSTDQLQILAEASAKSPKEDPE